jgi:adenylate cyclase
MAGGAVNRRWRSYKTLGWAAVALLFAALLDRNTLFGHQFVGPIAQFDPLVSDFIVYHLFNPPPPTGEVVIAAIDDQSIAELGRFPWPRSVEARLVDALAHDGVKAIGFDALFTERDPADVESDAFAARLRSRGFDVRSISGLIDPSGDQAFARSMKAEGATYLGYAFKNRLGKATALPPASTLLSTFLDPPPVAYNIVMKRPGPIRPPTLAESYLAPIAALNKAARGIAYVDIDEDEDGKARSYPVVVLFNGRYCAPLFLAIAQGYRDQASLALAIGPSGVEKIALGDRDIPVDEMGRMMIHYRGGAGTLPRYSVADLIDHKVPASALRDKIVMVGVTAHGLGDRFVTPVGSDFPGIELQATTVDNVLRGDFIHQSVSERGEERIAGWMLGIAIGVAAAFMSASASMALVALSAVAYFGYVAWRFESSGALVGVVFPLFALIFTYIAAVSYRYRTEGKEKRYLRSVFEMYLHPEVINTVVDDPEGLKLGGQRHHLSVLFADIIGFTALSERLEPEPLVALLNTYMSVMTEVILKSEGVVDKLMGDGIMAFWGAPLKLANAARASIDCALTMLQELKSLAARDERFKDLRIGIGIATGDAIVGNLGGERHFDYSAVGDTVNLASRIEGLTRQFKVNLLLNSATLEEADADYVTREIGLVKVKGKDQLVPLVEVAGRTGDGVDPSYYDRFGKAIAALHQGLSPEPVLRALLTERPDDSVTAMCLARLAETAGARQIVFEFDTK